MTKTKLSVLGFVLGSIFLISLLAFDKIIGGNATNGYCENNLYFVKDAKGMATEVSKMVFYGNYIYTIVSLVFIFLGIVSLCYLFYKVAIFLMNKKWSEFDIFEEGSDK